MQAIENNEDELNRIRGDEKSHRFMWIKETATVYLASLAPTFAAMKMTATIVGSVASQGNSEKDLDVVLQPLPGFTMTTECGLVAIYTHIAPLMIEGEIPEPLNTDEPEHSWLVNFGTRDGRTVEFYLPERYFQNVHPHELGLAKS